MVTIIFKIVNDILSVIDLFCCYLDISSYLSQES